MTKNISIGQCIQLRRRHWLVEAIEASDQSLLSIEVACLDDDASGERQLVIPACEITPIIVDDQQWHELGHNSPSDSKGYSSYLQSMQWNTSTAADNSLFQAPFRAGIEISPYQLVPLAKSLDLPRVNLLIADDVGLGKTIEAGLVLRELILRKRCTFFLVAAPSSMTQQWKEELSSKFGLTAEIVDAEFFARMRSERGFGFNPWQSSNAFIISHRLLRDEGYMVGLKAVLGNARAKSVFILDEAHHAAPSHGLSPDSKYAVDSQLTRSVRDLSKRFEHRLFLSATPHNGHSNSFSALLEMLDPKRFTRGIEVRQADHDAIMIRRLKADLRELTDTPFPKREVEAVELDGEIDELPELSLFQSLLDFGENEEANGGQSFVVLQKRLLSSVAAFTSTLEAEAKKIPEGSEALQTVARMLDAAKKVAFKGDAKSTYLANWIKEKIGWGSTWGERRVIVFSEFQTTIDWLHKQLLEQLGIEPESGIIAEFTGSTDTDERDRIKARFNADPASEPLRILLCTDAAREGINLQHRCYDLFHFDLPWNPSRLEQRNGRIDRRLQPNPEVYCRYFVYKNRPADRVLDALVRKTERINRELGEVGRVINKTIENRLKGGITRANLVSLEGDFKSEAYLEAERQKEELRLGPERSRRIEKLRKELDAVTKRLESSRVHKDVAPDALQTVFLNALEKMHLRDEEVAISKMDGTDIISINPESEAFTKADWTPVFDQLRLRPRNKKETLAEYREKTPIRRFSFEPVKDGERTRTDVEHLHLEHRLVRRMLSQFEAQGFRSRLEKTAVFEADIERSRVVLLVRMTLYAAGASRLHTEIIPVAANVGKDGLTPLKAEGAAATEVYRNLQQSIRNSQRAAEDICNAYCKRSAEDALFLRPIAEAIAEKNETKVRDQLRDNGERQADAIKRILEDQKERIIREKSDPQQSLPFNDDERRQREHDKAYWEQRLEEIEAELVSEPQNIRAEHEVSARRIEPVGIVYLIPRGQK